MPLIAGAPRVRVSRDGGRTYPRRHEQNLTRTHPSQPATVPVYNVEAGTGQLLAADFDASRAQAGPDRAAAVTADVAAFTALIRQLGARCITDQSPSGGQHVYVLFAQPLPWRELRDLTRALTLRFPTLDPAPMAGSGGQIRPPGARHRSGGWQLLTMPVEQALQATRQPCGPQVWTGLLAQLAAELAAVEPVDEPGNGPAGTLTDDTGAPWLPRRGGKRPLSPDLAAIARTGTWPHARYAGRSEARMAVIAAAAAAGWRLSDVRTQIRTGRWAGLAGLYERRSEPRRLERLLPTEWRNSVTWLAGEKNTRSGHTSDTNPRPPGRGGPIFENENDQEAEYGLIRFWVTASDCASSDPRRLEAWGRGAITIRLVLAALGQAAMVAGSSVIEFGVRNLALQAGISYRAAARALEQLRAENDPLVDLVSRHRLKRADRYQLLIPAMYAEQARWKRRRAQRDPLVDLVSRHRLKRADRYQLLIPAMYAEQARWKRRRAGRIEAIHPVFLILGGTAALTYAALNLTPAPAAQIARTARLSASAVTAALQLLADHGLAEHHARGWCRGSATLDAAADATGATRRHKERQAAYKADRDEWQGIIDSWLAGPDPVYEDNSPDIAIDDILEHLEPPSWITSDAGPPA